jgi:exosortase
MTGPIATSAPVSARAPSNGWFADAKALPSEIAGAWQQFPHRECFWVLLGAWLLLFHFLGNSTLGYVKTNSLFAWMIQIYEWSPDDTHGYFVPALVLVLLWWKQAELLPLPKRAWWPGLALLALALLVHVLGFLAQQARLSILGFYFGVYALTGLVWGGAWLRATWFPFCLLAFCVPVGSLTETITFPLRQLATSITVAISHSALGINVIQEGTRILDPTGRFEYEIAAACSGLRSLTALFVLTLIYGFMFFKKFGPRALIVLVAFPAALISNVLRLLMIVVAAQLFGQPGGNYVHHSPVLSFLPYVVGFSMVYLTGRLFQRPTSAQPSPNP